MTANQKYQKERAKEQISRIKKATQRAYIIYQIYSDSNLRHGQSDIQHKRLQLI